MLIKENYFQFRTNVIILFFLEKKSSLFLLSSRWFCFCESGESLSGSFCMLIFLLILFVEIMTMIPFPMRHPINNLPFIDFVRRMLMKIILKGSLRRYGLWGWFRELYIDMNIRLTFLLFLKLFEHMCQIVCHHLMIFHLLFLDVSDSEWPDGVPIDASN